MEQRFNIASITGTATLLLLSSMSVCMSAENGEYCFSKADATANTNLNVNVSHVSKEGLTNNSISSDLVEIEGHLLFRSLETEGTYILDAQAKEKEDEQNDAKQKR